MNDILISNGEGYFGGSTGGIREGIGVFWKENELVVIGDWVNNKVDKISLSINKHIKFFTIKIKN